MIYKIDTKCAMCPRREERNEMVDHWQNFENIINTDSDVKLVEEGTFRCNGPRKWSIGPLILGYTCEAETTQVPIVEAIDANHQL